jgi:hypothetical protein
MSKGYDSIRAALDALGFQSDYTIYTQIRKEPGDEYLVTGSPGLAIIVHEEIRGTLVADLYLWREVRDVEVHFDDGPQGKDAQMKLTIQYPRLDLSGPEGRIGEFVRAVASHAEGQK